YRLLREIGALLERTQLPALYVTHDHEEAFALADRIAVMRAGRIVQSGAPGDEWTAQFLGFGPAVDAECADGGVTAPWGFTPVAPAVEARGTVRPGAVRVVLRPDA